MKKLMFIAFVFISVIPINYLTSCNQAQVKVPERLGNIPQEAKWIGGTDGGNWYQLLEETLENTFKIRIYNDGNGEIEVDTTFVLNSECAIKKIDSSTLMKNIDGFDGEKIFLNLGNQQRCSLEMK